MQKRRTVESLTHLTSFYGETFLLKILDRAWMIGNGKAYHRSRDIKIFAGRMGIPDLGCIVEQLFGNAVHKVSAEIFVDDDDILRIEGFDGLIGFIHVLG